MTLNRDLAIKHAHRLKPVSDTQNRLKPGCQTARSPVLQCVLTHFADQPGVSTLGGAWQNTAPTSEVRFAAPAVPPLRPAARLSLAMATALGAMVGMMAGVFVALAGDSRGKQPPLRRAA